MVTQKDIAREAGVSSVTVSNVVNGNYHKVSEENIRKIQGLIEKYHYLPNATARSLAKKESQIIGVVIPNVSKDDNFLESPYYARVLGVLEQIVRNKGYYLMVRCVDKCAEIIPHLSAWNIDGVIFFGVFPQDVAAIKKAVHIPMVFMDTYVDSRIASSVVADDYKGGYLATKYLIDRGHRDILFAGPEIKGNGVIPKRYKGYEKAMREAGYGNRIRWQYIPFTSFECGMDFGDRIAALIPSPTAIFASADILALGVMAGLRRAGREIPGDISLVGFDNLAEGRYATPALTTVSQNIVPKAELTARQLFTLIQDKNASDTVSEVDVEIVERESVRSI